jgi:CheY-like chemotaxis protein
VSVGDTGTGMPREVLARALEPFYTTKPVGKGSGLGLSMVYGFVKQSGGHMTIYSEPGVGTTVRLYLPLTAPVIGHSASNEAPLPVIVTGDPVVLVIEDDDAVRTLQIRMLTQLGYQALEAADGTAGLDILRKGTKVDLLLSDVILPGGMNGPAFCATAQQSHPGLKVIYMSGYAPKAVTERYDLSGSQILTKPFTRAALAHALRHAFDTENTKD